MWYTKFEGSGSNRLLPITYAEIYFSCNNEEIDTAFMQVSFHSKKEDLERGCIKIPLKRNRFNYVAKLHRYLFMIDC